MRSAEILDEIIAVMVHTLPHDRLIKAHEIKSILWKAGLTQEDFDHIRAELLSYEEGEEV
ncbi:hypothetical protein LCGC14_1425290 [marine sediment metagenome]|uniref:Uncharacterized protein n=1 Tax=marine sediment metagenome TaxID=412755 RepID=A0A0F9JQL6_9ZZZZ